MDSFLHGSVPTPVCGFLSVREKQHCSDVVKGLHHVLQPLVCIAPLLMQRGINIVSYSCLLGITWKALGEGTRCSCLNRKTVSLPFTVFKQCLDCFGLLGQYGLC